MALAKFEQDPDLVGFWDREIRDGQGGTRYYRRINVEASCLACHGGKGSRPEFVKNKYPEDRAFDFNVGDLRGMYSVFIPDEVAGGSAGLFIVEGSWHHPLPGGVPAGRGGSNLKTARSTRNND